MPNYVSTDDLEALIRSLAEQLSQPPIQRAEVTLDDAVEEPEHAAECEHPAVTMPTES